ncbi:MAG TPA: hypothetical protein VFF73_16040, partial [Planctomycetota bacterium]|nr:hypothetical protein [Planctomycetota bacterium]
ETVQGTRLPIGSTYGVEVGLNDTQSAFVASASSSVTKLVGPFVVETSRETGSPSFYNVFSSEQITNDLSSAYDQYGINGPEPTLPEAEGGFPTGP